MIRSHGIQGIHLVLTCAIGKGTYRERRWNKVDTVDTGIPSCSAAEPIAYAKNPRRARDENQDARRPSKGGKS